MTDQKFFLSKSSLDKLSQVNKSLQDVVNLAIKITDVDFGVIEGLRSISRQQHLYAQGRTAPGPIVTWTMRSAHLTGNAVDLGAYVNGEYVPGNSSEELKLYDKIANAMMEAAHKLNVPLQWGIIDKNGQHKDFGHFEIKGEIK